MKTLFSVCVFLLLINSGAYAQQIAGIILEKTTNKPISFANVYFEGSSRRAVSNSEGRFTLDVSGVDRQIPLTISAVGYQSQKVTVDRTTELKIFLRPKVIQLQEVLITSDEGLSRAEKLKRFKKEFLGDTPNGRQCVFLNEDDIRLVYTKSAKTLKAYCDTAIVIHNKNLGYTITYYLEEFEQSPKGVYFQGNYFFKEEPGRNQKYERRRKIAYEGSRMHFIRSLWSNKLTDGDFVIRTSSGGYIDYQNIVEGNGDAKYIKPKDGILIFHKRFSKSFISGLNQPLYIAKNGYHSPLITWGGELGVKRLGDLLPFEYMP